MNNIAFITQNKFINIECFCADIAQVRNNVKRSPYKNILLFDLDTYRFTVQLFASLLEDRHVLLPPNAQPGTVEQLSSLCDATMGTITSEDKPDVSWSMQENDKPASDNDHATSEESLQTSRTALFAQLKGQLTFFTSGSTGKPKAIVKYVSQLISEIDILSASFSKQLQQSSCVVSTVSHQHIYGLLFKVLLPLRMGITVANKTFEYPEHISTFFDEVSSHGNDLIKMPVTGLLISSPAHLKRLVLDNVLIPIKKTISATFSSGGPLSFETSQSFAQQMQQAPIEVFGSTETGGIAWRCGQLTKRSPWTLLPTLSYKAIGPAGQLAISSPYVVEAGYLTDDLIQPIDANSFYLLGRVDRTIKLEEKRINLAHVERCLLAHPWVSEIRILVLPLSTKNKREVLAAVVELNQLAFNELKQQGKVAINDVLKQQLLTEFERISLPKKWRYVRALPYNAQGKTALNELERLFD
jgi:acyl-coenzyme A synthetase/AMP-(fatty) acid ligase